MQVYIVTTFIGTLGVDEKNKIIAFIRFPKVPAKIAEKMKLSEIEIIKEEKEIQKELWKKKYKKFIWGRTEYPKKYSIKSIIYKK